MNKRFTWVLAAILLCGTMTASAQKAEFTQNGKQVKRITFDREKDVKPLKSKEDES